MNQYKSPLFGPFLQVYSPIRIVPVLSYCVELLGARGLRALESREGDEGGYVINTGLKYIKDLVRSAGAESVLNDMMQSLRCVFTVSSQPLSPISESQRCQDGPYLASSPRRTISIWIA